MIITSKGGSQQRQRHNRTPVGALVRQGGWLGVIIAKHMVLWLSPVFRRADTALDGCAKPELNRHHHGLSQGRRNWGFRAVACTRPRGPERWAVTDQADHAIGFLVWH